MTKRVILVGNPNCGKTTLFNGLTGSQQRVGNWPGVTVEKKSGWYFDSEKTVEIIDLPGVYALSLPDQSCAKDAQITDQVLVDGHIDLIINIVDACHLERHLFLTSQLLELGKPVIVALNMMDIATQAGIQIDSKALSQQLRCPVVTLQAHRQIGLEQLAVHLNNPHPTDTPGEALSAYLPQPVVRYWEQLQKKVPSRYPDGKDHAVYYAYRWMEKPPEPESQSTVLIDDLDIVLADARYQMVHAWVAAAQTKRTDAKEQITAKLDRILLHRFWALPLFLTLMFGVFFLAIGVGGAVQTGFDMLSQAIFMQAPAWLMTQWHAPSWLIQIGAFGVGQAFHTLITFIPVLAIMYFLLAFLESSGYMARVAFIVDRVMRSLGLPGQAFVPMIIGFGCNVPAILAARTMQTERDRFLTVLMNPYMSCSARLAIYAVFVAAFFPTKGYQVIFSLYLMGIGMAILTGYLARSTFLSGPASPLMLELPAYHCPSLRRLAKEAGLRLRYFLVRAGKVILPLCVGLSCLNMGSIGTDSSVLAYVGHWLTPMFAPMGIEADNWPAVMSLVTGMLAKEVVIGTLNHLYSQINHVTDTWQVLTSLDLWQICQQSILTIYEHLALLLGFATSAPVSPGAEAALPNLLTQYFASPIAAYAYLLFILLYIPCVSTMAAIRQEATRRLMWFSIVWSLGLAYGVAVAFYQIATWMSSPAQVAVMYRIGWGACLVALVGVGLKLAKSGGRRAISHS